MQAVPMILCEKCRQPVLWTKWTQPAGISKVLAMTWCGHCYHHACLIQMHNSSIVLNAEGQTIFYCVHPGCNNLVKGDQIYPMNPLLTTIYLGPLANNTLQIELQFARDKLAQYARNTTEYQQSIALLQKRASEAEAELNRYKNLYHCALRDCTHSHGMGVDLENFGNIRMPKPQELLTASNPNAAAFACTQNQPEPMQPTTVARMGVRNTQQVELRPPAPPNSTFCPNSYVLRNINQYEPKTSSAMPKSATNESAQELTLDDEGNLILKTRYSETKNQGSEPNKPTLLIEKSTQQPHAPNSVLSSNPNASRTINRDEAETTSTKPKSATNESAQDQSLDD